MSLTKISPGERHANFDFGSGLTSPRLKALTTYDDNNLSLANFGERNSKIVSLTHLHTLSGKSDSSLLLPAELGNFFFYLSFLSLFFNFFYFSHFVLTSFLLTSGLFGCGKFSTSFSDHDQNHTEAASLSRVLSSTYARRCFLQASS